MQSLRVNNLRILRIKNEELSKYYFYVNWNILGDFQICISVPLKYHQKKKWTWVGEILKKSNRTSRLP